MDSIPIVSMILSNKSAHFREMFGAGQPEARLVSHELIRYGPLTVDPYGSSNAGAFKGEAVYYVLKGTGILGYAGKEVPISQGDFFYVPPGIDHRFIDPREAPLKVMLMEFKVNELDELSPPHTVPPLQIANEANVSEEILGGHGPTVSYQLLLGGADSKRDRIPAGRQVTSLFIMNFHPGGTNHKHHHPNAVEIYYLLRGHGQMIAGLPNGKPKEYPAKAGDAFLFRRSTPVGFISGTHKGEPNTRILAIRILFPNQ
jgi:mannose-6-phosphate isomerase-like protein (cupin superfamily)